MAVAERASVTDLHKTLKADPSDTRALLRLAEHEAKAGRSAAACETYTRAGDVFTGQGFARRALSAYGLGMAVAREGAVADRVLPLARAMGKLYLQEKLVRDAVTTLDGAARWLIERGFDADALPLITDRIAIEDSEVARVRLAETYFRIGEPVKAVDELVAVFERLHKQGRRDEALDVAERLLGERRHVPVARAAADLYLARNRKGDPFLALAKIRICCEDDPTHIPTLETLARAFDLAGHGEKATRVRREIASLTTPRQSAPAPRPESAAPAPRPAAPPRPSAIRPKVVVPKPVVEDSIDCAWDELLEEANASASATASVPPAPESRIDPGRPSFWPVDDSAGADDSGSVVSVSLADVELVDANAPKSTERPSSLLETALEHLEALIAQGRYPEASVLVVRHLTTRPKNPLLLERKREIEDMLNALHEGPPPALFGLARPRPRGDSERSIPTRTVQARRSANA